MNFLSFHPARDWRRFGGANADSPIHSHRLTAMYFPGALRNATNQEATVSGTEASAAVRAGQHLAPSTDGKDVS